MKILSNILKTLMPIKPLSMGIQTRPQPGDPDDEWRWNGHDMCRVEGYIYTVDESGIPKTYCGAWVQTRPPNDNEILQFASGIIKTRYGIFLCDK